jgi:surfeit locus 1 family protein
MKYYFWVLGQKFELFSALFVAVCIFCLISLGNWQLKRLSYKNEFISNIERNVRGSAVLIASDAKDVELYSKVKVSGHFLQGKDVLLYGRRSASAEKDGYYLLSPFKADNGFTYLVSRGWVPQSKKTSIKEFEPPKHEEIIAIAMPGEGKRFFMPENDIENGVWFTLDLNMASNVFGTDSTGFYLMQIGAEHLPQGASPLSATYLNKIRNDHLEYAITWYILAACLLCFYVIYSRKNC